MKRKINDFYLIGFTLFYLIALIRSDYDVLVWAIGMFLLIAGIVLYIRNKKDAK